MTQILACNYKTEDCIAKLVWPQDRDHSSRSRRFRRKMTYVMFQAAVAEWHHNLTIYAVIDRMRNFGKPHKVIINKVARKLPYLANALA